MGKCRMKEYRTNEVIDRTGSPLICQGGFGQPPCKYYKECRADMLFRTRKIKKIDLMENPGNKNAETEYPNVHKGREIENLSEDNEGLDGFPEVHI